jgi:Spy/CpxP family protein refolding chaperone
MNRLCCWLLPLAFALAAQSVRAQDKPKPPDRPPGPGSGPFPAMRPLLTPGTADKLGLNAKQKEEIDKLQKELGDKQREAFTKLREAYEKAMKDGNKEALSKVQEQAKEMMQAMQKQHQEAEAKLKDILNEEQQKKYEQLKKAAPFGFPGGPPGGGFPMGSYRMFPGQVLPPPVQDMLKLTAEQKEKINRIQKEAEDKIMEVLTEDQKKRIEDLKKRFPGAPPPPPPRERG